MEVVLEKGWVSSDFMVKSKRKDNTVISGYASVFGVIDTHNDVVVKGAFKNTESRKVKLLWQHDVTKPIGIISLLKEDEYGLLLEAEININTVAGAEAAELIKQKAVAGLSIGFSINSSDYNKEGSRVISDIELREISIVTFPANQNAEIQYIKEIDIAEPLLEQKKLNELAKLVKQIENY
jgi:HK97 family phage prohead protease